MPTNNTNCPPFYGFSTESCSGHGQCVDASAFSTEFSHLCECDDGWSGATDMFDLRVALNPLTNKALALDCPMSSIMTYFFFVLLAVAYFIRYVVIFVALISKIKTMPKKSRMEGSF